MRTRATPLQIAIYAIPLLFLAVFFLYPLGAILWLSFADATGGLAALFADGYYARVFWFSVWQAALSTVLTLAVGLPAAFVFARFNFPGKTFLRALATIPFVLPTVVVVAAFTALLGPRGLANTVLQTALGLSTPPIQIMNTFAAILLAHVFYNYSVVLRIVGTFWSTLDPRLEQAAATLGANRRRVFQEVTLPLLLPAIGAAALLVFIFTFSSFGVVLILGGPRFATVEVEIYRQTAQLLRLDIAAALSLIQMAVTLIMTIVYTRLQSRSVAPLEQRARSANARPVRSWQERLLVGGNVVVLLLLIGAPLLALACRSIIALGREEWTLTFDYYTQLGVNRTRSFFFASPARAILNSLLFATGSTILALLVGVPAAYLLANQSTKTSGAKRSAGLRARSSMLLDALFMLPLGASAVTLGLGYIVALGRPPLNLLRSPLLIPFAHALLAFPFVVRSLLPALRSLDPRLREAALVSGASPIRVLREIDFPLLFPALLVGAVFAFTVSLGEFGATLLLSRPEYPTVPVVIYRFLGQPGAANYGQALALSTILMLLSGLGFVLLEQLRFRDIGEF